VTSAQTPAEHPLEDTIEEVLTGGDRPPVGRYRLDLATGQWAWSDEVYVMHGFEPGQIVPTTPLMLSHKHPDDRARVDGVLRRAAETGQPFSSVHRIRDVHGRTRTLAVTGQGRRDPATGRVTELFGYFIDVTKSQREAAKGVLMVVYGIDEESAFEQLRQASNLANIPVRDIAYTLVHLFSGPNVTVFPTREAIDEFLDNPVPPGDH